MKPLYIVIPCVSIYLFSFIMGWIYYHIYFGKKGKGYNKRIDKDDVYMSIFFPGINTLAMLYNWIFDFPVRMTGEDFLRLNKDRNA